MIRKIIGVTVGTTMNPKKIAGNMPAHKYSWNDLTDKPFGEVEGFEITWDGNTEDKIYTQFVEVIEGTCPEDENYKTYLISELTPSDEDLKKGIVTVVSIVDGETITEDVALSELWDLVANEQENVTAVSVVVVCRKDNTVLEMRDGEDSPVVEYTMTFPKAGVYFVCRTSEYGKDYVSRLHIPGEVEPLDEKFIPDTIATKEYVHQLLGTNIEDIASLIGGDA